MTYPLIIKEQLQEAASVLESFMSDDHNVEKIEKAAQLMVQSIKNGGKIIACGNGGSHCDAMHFAEELSGKFREDRRSLPAIAISDPSYLSCTGNDFGFEHVFSRFIEGLGKKGDVLLAISTSGNSKNVIRAVEAAHTRGLYVVALTGKSGGHLGGLADIEIRVPHQGYADRVQEVHIKVIHIMILLMEKML